MVQTLADRMTAPTAHVVDSDRAFLFVRKQIGDAGFLLPMYGYYLRQGVNCRALLAFGIALTWRGPSPATLERDDRLRECAARLSRPRRTRT
jgi:hypothetical protein